MNIEFNWTGQPDPTDQSSVETELKTTFEDGAIPACHPGVITISLEISGPLNTKLTGSAQCACGKIITTFTGDNAGTSINYRVEKN